MICRADPYEDSRIMRGWAIIKSRLDLRFSPDDTSLADAVDLVASKLEAWDLKVPNGGITKRTVTSVTVDLAPTCYKCDGPGPLSPRSRCVKCEYESNQFNERENEQLRAQLAELNEEYANVKADKC